MTESRVLGRDNRVQLSTYPAHQVHYKTTSLIISRIIRLELVVDYQPDYQLNYQQDYQPGSTEVPAW